MRKDPVTKRRLWNESLYVCDECVKDAQRLYPYESFDLEGLQWRGTDQFER